MLSAALVPFAHPGLTHLTPKPASSEAPKRHSKKVLAPAQRRVWACFLVKPREKPSGPFSRWWSCRPCFVTCSWPTDWVYCFSWVQRDHHRPEFLEDFHDYADLVCLQPIRASILVVAFKSPFNGQFQFCNAPCRAGPLRMLATFWQCCLTNPWQLGWMPQEQWLSGKKDNKELLCAGFPNISYLMYQHFLSFSIIYCTAYCWWQPSRYRSWSRCNTRRTCLNFLAAFQRERRRRRRLENIQQNIKKQVMDSMD